MKKPIRGFWILATWTGSDTPWPPSINSLVAYANWVKSRQRTSAFTCSGKTSRQRSVPLFAGAIRVGANVLWCFGRGANWLPPLMSPLDRLYELLQYPRFFPHDCCGWFPGLTSTRPPYQRVTQMEYYRQRLVTEPRFGLLGRLLNEYLMDMFSSLEDNRLNYVRQHVQTRIAARRELDETI